MTDLKEKKFARKVLFIYIYLINQVLKINFISSVLCGVKKKEKQNFRIQF